MRGSPGEWAEDVFETLAGPIQGCGLYSAEGVNEKAKIFFKVKDIAKSVPNPFYPMVGETPVEMTRRTDAINLFKDQVKEFQSEEHPRSWIWVLEQIGYLKRLGSGEVVFENPQDGVAETKEEPDFSQRRDALSQNVLYGLSPDESFKADFPLTMYLLDVIFYRLLILWALRFAVIRNPGSDSIAQRNRMLDDLATIIRTNESDQEIFNVLAANLSDPSSAVSQWVDAHRYLIGKIKGHPTDNRLELDARVTDVKLGVQDQEIPRYIPAIREKVEHCPHAKGIINLMLGRIQEEVPTDSLVRPFMFYQLADILYQHTTDDAITGALRSALANPSSRISKWVDEHRDLDFIPAAIRPPTYLRTELERYLQVLDRTSVYSSLPGLSDDENRHRARIASVMRSPWADRMLNPESFKQPVPGPQGSS